VHSALQRYREQPGQKILFGCGQSPDNVNPFPRDLPSGDLDSKCQIASLSLVDELPLIREEALSWLVRFASAPGLTVPA
jgi:hypothetical protein